MQNKQLIKRAVVIFPRTDYTDVGNVRHARKEWLKAIAFLRDRDNGSAWILDKKIPAQKYAN